MKKSAAVAIALLVVLVASGCTSKTPTSTTTSPTTTTYASTTAPTTSTTLGPAASTTTSVSSTETTTFTAELAGAEVVPAVDTIATGTATFTVDATRTRVHFVLKVSNLTDVIASRLHEGARGSNGQGVLILYPGPTRAGLFTGVLSEGNFNASALIGSLTGKTIADLVALLESGQAYVNVGTLKNPKGEIRGQVR